MEGGEVDSKISSAHINTSKLPKKYFKNLGWKQLYLTLPLNERRQLTTFEEEAKKIYYIFKMKDIIIKNPCLYRRKIKFNINNFQNCWWKHQIWKSRRYWETLTQGLEKSRNQT